MTSETASRYGSCCTTAFARSARQRSEVPEGGCYPEALRGEQRGDGPPQSLRAGARANPDGVLAAALEGRDRGRARAIGNGILQRVERRAEHRQSLLVDGRAARLVELRWIRGVRSGRRQ